MTATNLEIGTRVGYAETFRGIKWVKIGNVVEVDAEKGRVRVKWAFWLYPSGHRKEDTKRTWVKSSRLIVNPAE